MLRAKRVLRDVFGYVGWEHMAYGATIGSSHVSYPNLFFGIYRSFAVHRQKSGHYASLSSVASRFRDKSATDSGHP